MFGHDNNEDEHKGTVTLPTVDDSGQDDTSDDTASVDTPAVAATPAPAEDTELGSFLPGKRETPAATGNPATDDLLDIKQEALQALTPLVNHLDQTPEEHFRTTMMMIQASDNHALVKVAYEAAKGITDEKERAQALLDIVNEINYFTQHPAA